MIELTTAGGRKIWVAAWHILTMSKDGSGTTLVMRDEFQHTVQQEPRIIAACIKSAMCQIHQTPDYRI